MSRRRHELSNEDWNRVKDMLPGQPGHAGDNGKDNQLFLNAIFWIAKTGAPWRDLPERFGNWNSVFKRFSRWSEKGVWESIFKELSSDADLEWLMIDSTVNRAHQHSAGAKKGEQITLLDALEVDCQLKFMLP